MSRLTTSPALAAIAALGAYVLRWLLLAGIVGILAGSAAAVFLIALDRATTWREAHTWIIALLPLAGLAIGLAYHRYGRAVEGGNNLVLEEIHQPRAQIPLRMTPMILISTVATHLFGGSAGREGTAVQMGASLADRLCSLMRLAAPDRRVLLMAGMSGGFAAVFGTPLAGTVFGLEVLTIGALRSSALLPCLIAAVVGDRCCLAWGVQHTLYSVPSVPAIDTTGLLVAVVAGCAFGLSARLFVAATHVVAAVGKRWFAYPPLRPLIGGALIATLVLALGWTRYIGLGIPGILAAFAQPALPWDFAIKIALTALTLGCGFKGGEVTPLFFIGVTLGSALSRFLPLPTAVLAGMGFAAVFASAANTPLACTLLAMELFGGHIGVYAAVACVVAYLCSGSVGIYHAQRGDALSKRHHPEDRSVAER